MPTGDQQGFEEGVSLQFTKRDARAARGPAYARALSSIPVNRQPDGEKSTPETEWRRKQDIWGSLEVIRDVLLSIVEDFERAKMFDAIAYLQRVGGAAQERNDPNFTDNPINSVTTFPGLIKTLGGSATLDRRDIDAIYVLIDGLVPESIIDAKGDLLAGTAADTLARVPVGTNGKVLTADSTATPGVSWQTPTGGVSNPMTSDLAAGGFKITGYGTPTAGDDVTDKTYVDAGDALAIPKSIVTTKGDVIIATGSATPVRLGIGANNTILTADSVQTEGAAFKTLATVAATLLTAKGDLLTRTLAAAGRLAVGADNSVLMADSAATPGIKWAAQSLIDHGTLGGLADDDHTQYTRKDTLTTKGDLYAATAASTPARVAVGANTTILMADSAQTPGVKWAAQSLIDHGSIGGLTDDDHAQYTLVAGTRAFTGDQSMGSHKLTNVTDPASAQDAATKNYVDTADALAIPKSLVDAKGDILAGTADNTVARVAVGANNRALVADSGSTPGVKWGGAVNNIQHTTSGGFTDLRHDFAHTQTALATLAVTIDRLYAFPVWIPRPIGFDRLGFELTTGSAGAGKVRVGIYSNAGDTDVRPDALIYDSGEFSGTDVESPATGVKEKTGLSQTIATPGLYWFAFVAGTSAPTVRALQPGSIIPVLGMDSAGNARNCGVIRTYTYAALPDPFGTPATRPSNMPQVFVRVASAS